ncbi:MAG: hypothetical protein OXC01_08175 [Immundisolibacterales bacterium]|nr:hypothetical protein [Immundisolibacterales bacterium]
MRDTLSALRDLEAAGIDSMHAEAIVGVVARAHEELATKDDLAAAVAATKADLAALEARIEARIEACIERAMNRNLLATIAVGGVVIAAVKLL